MRLGTSPGINPPFDGLSRCPGYVTCFVLSLSPLVQAQSYDRIRLVRLACLNHAASVRSEPGSNSSIGKRLSQDTTLLTRVYLAFFNTPLGHAGRFRPAPPDLHPPGTPRRVPGRLDTLPFCLGSDCLLDKDRNGPKRPHEKRECSTPSGSVNTPLVIFLFFRTPVVWTASGVPKEHACPANRLNSNHNYSTSTIPCQ